MSIFGPDFPYDDFLKHPAVGGGPAPGNPDPVASWHTLQPKVGWASAAQPIKRLIRR